MAQQKLTPTGNTGADARRVLDTLTPLNGVAAPTVQATFLGQMFVDTVASKVYMSIATDSAAPADDWVQISNA